MFRKKPTTGQSYALILDIRLSQTKNCFVLDIQVGYGSPIQGPDKSFYFTNASRCSAEGKLSDLPSELASAKKKIHLAFDQAHSPVERVDLTFSGENLDTIHTKKSNVSVADALAEYESFLEKLAPIIALCEANEAEASQRTSCTLL